MKIETVATVLERETSVTIEEWYKRIEKEPEIMAIRMSREKRCAHLPALFHDLVSRLRSSKRPGSKEIERRAAAEHGVARRQQGYTAAMMVEESRMLQVSIFKTLKDNQECFDFSELLSQVMTIADEVDSQLSQAMSCYMTESFEDALRA